MPGFVFVLGCDPECWLVELNQHAHKLNFQHAFFAGSFNLMVELLLIISPLCSDQFREPEETQGVHKARIHKAEAKLMRYYKINKPRALQAAQ